MNRRIFGYELMVDILDCNVNIKDSAIITDFVAQLCSLTDMVPHCDTIIEHTGKKSEEFSGYTMVQLLDKSSITAHFSDFYRSMHLNVFSCKDFDKQLVLDVAAKTFGGYVDRAEVITRYCK